MTKRVRVKGSKLSENHKQRIAEALSNKPHTEEHNKRVSDGVKKFHEKMKTQLSPADLFRLQVDRCNNLVNYPKKFKENVDVLAVMLPADKQVEILTRKPVFVLPGMSDDVKRFQVILTLAEEAGITKEFRREKLSE